MPVAAPSLLLTLTSRWQSDDGSKFNDFDADLSFRLESALNSGHHQFQVPERNWLFDLVAMKQTNIQVAAFSLSPPVPCVSSM